MSVPVIFLDIDGVLNYAGHHPPHGPNWPASHLCTQRIALLNQIIQTTQAVCVLSSAWRHLTTPAVLQAIMTRLGFCGRIVDATGRGINRGREICQWLQAHRETQRFVVLDGEAHGLTPLHEHLVQTTFNHGLEPVHVQQAIHLLIQATWHYYHGIALHNGDRTWSCGYCGFRAASPAKILAAETGCTVGKLPCNYCGGGRECTPDCPGVAHALAQDGVHLAGSLAPTEHET